MRHQRRMAAARILSASSDPANAGVEGDITGRAVGSDEFAADVAMRDKSTTEDGGKPPDAARGAADAADDARGVSPLAHFDVLMRYSGSLYGVGDPIAEHRRVLERRGRVWLGKFGKPLAISRIEVASARAARGDVVWLYLASSATGNWQVHRGRIAQMTRELPRGAKRDIPDYYVSKDLLNLVSTWTCLMDLQQLHPSVLAKLHVASSGSTARHALTYSQNGVFIVRSARKVNRR